MKPHFSSGLLAAVVVLATLPPVFAGAGAATTPAQPELKVDASPVSEGRPGMITSYADVVEPVQKAVVSVYSTKIVRSRNSARERKEEGLGSGVIVSPNGYILTNNHVVADADELNVELSDGRQLKAKVIGADEKTDIAVIKIEAEGLPIVTLADSDKLRVGDIVFAVGNPLGVGQTVTMGIVSATGRTDLQLLDNVDGGYEDFIQTDAAINMGNSGGALVDAKGRLVGINSAIISPSEGNIGIGFSIPVNLVAGIMRNILHNGKVQRGYLGVKSETLTSEVATSAGLKPDLHGVLVTEVTADGPAAKAGVKFHDVIISIGDHPIVSLSDLRLTVSQTEPGTAVNLKLLRDGKEQTLKVSVAKLDESVDTSNDLLPGVTVTKLDADTRKQFGLDDTVKGLLIAAVARNSPYARTFIPGMVVVEINGTAVSDLAAARKLLQSGQNTVALSYGGMRRNRILVLP